MDSSGKKSGGGAGPRGFSRREWDPVFASEKMIEKDVFVSGLGYGGNADVVRVSLNPIWLHPVWSSPRDLCVLRHGREIKDLREGKDEGKAKAKSAAAASGDDSGSASGGSGWWFCRGMNSHVSHDSPLKHSNALQARGPDHCLCIYPAPPLPAAQGSRARQPLLQRLPD